MTRTIVDKLCWGRIIKVMPGSVDEAPGCCEKTKGRKKAVSETNVEQLAEAMGGVKQNETTKEELERSYRIVKDILKKHSKIFAVHTSVPPEVDSRGNVILGGRFSAKLRETNKMVEIQIREMD